MLLDAARMINCFGVDKYVPFYHRWKPLPGDNGLAHCYYVFINELWGTRSDHAHIYICSKNGEPETLNVKFLSVPPTDCPLLGLLFSFPGTTLMLAFFPALEPCLVGFA